MDRDAGADIPVDTLHDDIRKSAACLADITPDNPNVWYELGYAVASDQPVVMICAKGRKLPFDTHHRNTIFYSLESSRDFDELRSGITDRLKAVLARQAKVQEVVTSPVKPTEGLKPHEIAVLALLIANRGAPEDDVSEYKIKEDMRRAGYNDVATSIALTNLERNGYVKSEQLGKYNEWYFGYWLLQPGEDWLLKNQDKLELRRTQPQRVDKGITDDDVPF